MRVLVLKETRARKKKKSGGDKEEEEMEWWRGKERGKSCEGAEATRKQVSLTDSYGTHTQTHTLARAHKHRDV